VSITFFAASRAIGTRLFTQDMEPLVSTTITTSFGPDAAVAYHGRKRGS